MRIEEIIGEIAQSSEYRELIGSWDLIKDNPTSVPKEIQDDVCRIVDFLEEELSKARKNFLKSILNGWRPKNGKTSFYFNVPESAQREWEAFVKETNRQMPTYKAVKDWCETA